MCGSARNFGGHDVLDLAGVSEKDIISGFVSESVIVILIKLYSV
jgi:hypothetical protein